MLALVADGGGGAEPRVRPGLSKGSDCDALPQRLPMGGGGECACACVRVLGERDLRIVFFRGKRSERGESCDRAIEIGFGDGGGGGDGECDCGCAHGVGGR